VSGVIAAAVILVWYYDVYRPGDLDLWLQHSKFGTDTSVIQRIFDALYLLVTMLLELLPGLILIAPFTLVLIGEKWPVGCDLPIALWLYGICTMLVLVVWPHANGRYAMPGMLGLAALAGLAFERYRSERPQLVRAALVVGSLLLAYRVTLSWVVMPALPDLFRSSGNAAMGVTAAVNSHPPMKLYMVGEAINKNILAYLRVPFRVISLHELNQIAAPAWLLGAPEIADFLQQQRPDLDLVFRGNFVDNGPNYLIEVRAK